MRRNLITLLLAGILTVLPGCSLLEQVFLPDGDAGPGEPAGLPVELQDVVDILGELGLPDISELGDLPGLDSLPLLETIPGGMVFRGPVQRRITSGDYMPGTNLRLIDAGEDVAEFDIDGLRSFRRVGDSLDFDGRWPQLPGVEYSTRLRIYQISQDRVGIAGVHQLGIRDVEPRKEPFDADRTGFTFPFAANVGDGEFIPGTTYGYDGVAEQGARLSGMAGDVYPYRKTGDSIVWRGALRPDIPVEYRVRVIHFDANALQVGGVVSVFLPMRSGE